MSSLIRIDCQTSLIRSRNQISGESAEMFCGFEGTARKGLNSLVNSRKWVSTVCYIGKVLGQRECVKTFEDLCNEFEISELIMSFDK